MTDAGQASSPGSLLASSFRAHFLRTGDIPMNESFVIVSSFGDIRNDDAIPKGTRYDSTRFKENSF
jgi:hypothetical protein